MVAKISFTRNIGGCHFLVTCQGTIFVTILCSFVGFYGCSYSCDKLFRRFNGLNFLKGNRGKKIMFVGDSLSLNQFNSLACMIHAAVPNSRSTFRQRDAISSVTFEVGSFHSFTFMPFV
jgi:hypothetical protein